MLAERVVPQRAEEVEADAGFSAARPASPLASRGLAYPLGHEGPANNQGSRDMRAGGEMNDIHRGGKGPAVLVLRALYGEFSPQALAVWDECRAVDFSEKNLKSQPGQASAPYAAKRDFDKDGAMFFSTAPFVPSADLSSHLILRCGS